MVFVPFHSPLNHDAEVIAEAEDFLVRITKARTYGKRLEIKRAGAELAPATVQLSC
jgi:hypothetical protein